MTDIKPALTAEEWKPILNPPRASVSEKFRAEWEKENGPMPPRPVKDVIQGLLYDEVSDQWGHAAVPENCHAVAALSLYGQPFGFTREMLRALKTLLANHIAEDRGRDGDTWYSDELEKLVALGQDTADRIEALLPPEKPS